MSGWGDQLGSLAMGVGGAAADYELAKHDPKGYVSMQKWTFIALLVIFLIMGGVFVVAKISSSGNKDK